MKKRRPIEIFSISFLDLLSGALGAVIILYVAIPKNQLKEIPKNDKTQVLLKKDLADAQIKIGLLTTELNKKVKQLAIRSAAPTEQLEKQIFKGADLDIGFKFKGRNIVFVIDTSYSMIEEERMSAVKAGIKMFLTSLPGDYQIEIFQFPLSERAPFRTLWGTIKEFSSFNRMDAFDFIHALRPSGGTPTRETLLFVLENYETISDIVLLTDGAPTFHNSNKKDDIYDILRVVREKNSNKVQINTIGVGSNFLKDKTSEQFRFLTLLASEHKGFFVGF